MAYGTVYVAQCAMGADKNQFVRAMKEAEAFHGPSLIICYAPCINHGLVKGMGMAQIEMKRAVESGYWNLYRYNPELTKQNKDPFLLDSKEPTMELKEFMMGEVRFASLYRKFPEEAEKRAKQDPDEGVRVLCRYYGNRPACGISAAGTAEAGERRPSARTLSAWIGEKHDQEPHHQPGIHVHQDRYL